MTHKWRQGLIAALLGFGVACPLEAAQHQCTVTTVGGIDLIGPCTDINPGGTDLHGTPLIGPNENFTRQLGTSLDADDTIIEDTAAFWDGVLAAELANAGVNPLAPQFGGGDPLPET